MILPLRETLFVPCRDGNLLLLFTREHEAQTEQNSPDFLYFIKETTFRTLWMDSPLTLLLE